MNTRINNQEILAELRRIDETLVSLDLVIEDERPDLAGLLTPVNIALFIAMKAVGLKE